LTFPSFRGAVLNHGKVALTIFNFSKLDNEAKKPVRSKGEDLYDEE